MLSDLHGTLNLIWRTRPHLPKEMTAGLKLRERGGPGKARARGTEGKTRPGEGTARSAPKTGDRGGHLGGTKEAGSRNEAGVAGAELRQEQDLLQEACGCHRGASQPPPVFCQQCTLGS